MFSPIHPRYQTVARRALRDERLIREPKTRRLTLGDIYERIDEDLAEL